MNDTVKSDSKGRLTGAEPGVEYKKHVSPEGDISYSPAVPKRFDEVREVTREMFEAFFGCTPEEFSVDGLRVLENRFREGAYPTSIIFQKFDLDEDGNRKYKSPTKRIWGKEGPGLAQKKDVRIVLLNPTARYS